MNTSESGFHIEYNPGTENTKQLSHHHTAHEIIFVKDGSADFVIENKRYSLVPNRLLLISNFEKHEHIKISGTYKRYILLADNQLFEPSMFDNRLMSVFMSRPSDYCHVITLSDADALSAEKLFIAMLEEHKNKSDYSSGLIKLKLCELLILLFRKSPSNFPDFSNESYAGTVLKVQKYLNGNFRKDVSLKQTAALFYTDMYYLSVKFKEIVGYPFKQYLTNLRLSYAKHLLITTKMPVADICTESGFNDLSNFLRVFKSAENISPLQFRILKTC